MKLWLISQNANSDYDTYDSAVVAADTEEAARQIHPGGDWEREYVKLWCDRPDQVTVEYIGEAAPETKSGVILASFNAG